MNIQLFIQRSEALHQYLADLYQTATLLPWIPSDLLPQAFKELHSTSKMLQLAAEELYQQNEELMQNCTLLETQRQHYQELFEFAPAAYLVTDQQGIIQEANRLASQLLNIDQNVLVGKPITNFISQEQHSYFFSTINQISKSEQIREILLRLQPRHDDSFDASLKVKSVANQQQTKLHWLIHKSVAYQPVESTDVKNFTDLIENRPIHKHSKGEIITLIPLLIWFVRHGLVKLSAFSETGAEIITGLAKPGMIFGSSMTSLPIYQATAIADVEVVPIYLSEIAATPNLNKILLPKIQQRLQQTQSFLFIAGQRKVPARLQHLLELLKQQIGEPVPEGTRLCFRLTHEDIANICGTTRVTITRLLSQFQQQGKIQFDHKKHIIIIHNS
ncbi:helix-turn-helix domain-containing protein [Sphaerospermopsis kisseleviana CS-549]|uniref:Helix-turn-helix domain-containing protein n=1 Tax=Sphaerospermopsis kisseleviana CS-549 TaxID=3021783 RepID=A0ABT4ZVH7_9CYAN|nr:helix-turn-helix domain-containing protein [Sphaerospermopsis kisseleviana]MBD2146581.1 helix-turn-helix domain-containing protein [Sphaerospermopsis sp. FACHB-1194]MDB9443433.1 helix-turn-helix domain-containing protein [Sphaerospermopsis kisseleviana CS-549]BAZ80696.1 putative Crp/Fnr family transcriptional regulator [Sphaerospermopsis kisseleviana NIES-73]